MEHLSQLHFRGLTYVVHVRVLNQNQVHHPQLVVAVMDPVFRQLDKDLLQYKQFVVIVMGREKLLEIHA